jgi:hypothetical protein
MLFARFLAENNLLIEPSTSTAITLQECQELAREQSDDWLELASGFAEGMLPQIFRKDDPVLDVILPAETRSKLESKLEALPSEIFLTDDSLGWVYQFWQAEKKDEINRSEKKIGADELPAVTQLFTEDYMVLFLLHNTLGAWWAGKVLAAKPELAVSAKSEDELRAACSVGDIKWEYLRFIKSPLPQGEGHGEGGVELWRLAAGTFDSWPREAKNITMLDPCMGSGHFLVFALPILVAFRMAEDGLSEASAIDAVLSNNLFGLEIDTRCTQIAAFNLALAAWRRVGYCALPSMHLACAGLGVVAKKEDWLSLAPKSEKMQAGMERLYHLFQKAPVLGSLINPTILGGDLLMAEFRDLQPLMEQALKLEATDEKHELAVTAKGISEASEILAGHYTLVGTNVPYLGRGKQDEVLMEYSERVYPDARADLATCFVKRCLNFCASGGSTALVTPQNWLFLGQYRKFRETLISSISWQIVVRLGARAFETISGEVVNVALLVHSRLRPDVSDGFLGLDVSESKDAAAKKASLLTEPVAIVNQISQLKNPDARIVQRKGGTELEMLSQKAVAYQGLVTGDRNSYIFTFWEIPAITKDWEPFADAYSYEKIILGRENIIYWEQGKGRLYKIASENRDRLHDMHESGNLCWGKKGVLLTRIGLRATPYYGERFDNNLICIIPFNETDISALWNYCCSDDYKNAVQELDQKLSLTNATACKVGVNLQEWVAGNSFPPPFSSDPTQWIFSGYPKGSDHPLQVSVTRLLGYQWPRQTGSSFMDCPALQPDGLEKHSDADGIVCVTPLRGEPPADQRLIALLADAFGVEWSAGKLASLLTEVGFEGKTLDDWLRDGFFEQHRTVFHQRPFIWHIWDGRRDGFHVLVNYHKLTAPNGEGRRTLEILIYTYLGDWIDRQRADQKAGVEGADGRVAAAMHLKAEL